MPLLRFRPRRSGWLPPRPMPIYEMLRAAHGMPPYTPEEWEAERARAARPRTDREEAEWQRLLEEIHRRLAAEESLLREREIT